MKKWELTASIDGVNIDYSEILKSEVEPDFWTCYDIASAHGCKFFTVEEIPADTVVYDRTAAERLRELVDVLTPQQTADAVGHPVMDGGTVYHPTPGRCKP